MEAKRRARKQAKDERRAQRKAERAQRAENPPEQDQGVDPDIADIVPGPQPPRF